MCGLRLSGSCKPLDMRSVAKSYVCVKGIFTLTQNGRGGSEAVAGTVRVPRQRRSATQAQVRAEKSRFFDGQPPLAVPLFRRPVQSRDEKLENSRDRTHWVYGVYLGVWCLSIG